MSDRHPRTQPSLKRAILLSARVLLVLAAVGGLVTVVALTLPRVARDSPDANPHPSKPPRAEPEDKTKPTPEAKTKRTPEAKTERTPEDKAKRTPEPPAPRPTDPETSVPIGPLKVTASDKTLFLEPEAKDAGPRAGASSDLIDSVLDDEAKRPPSPAQPRPR